MDPPLDPLEISHARQQLFNLMNIFNEYYLLYNDLFSYILSPHTVCGHCSSIHVTTTTLGNIA